MKSYFAGFTANEMALIKGNRRKKITMTVFASLVKVTERPLKSAGNS